MKTLTGYLRLHSHGQYHMDLLDGDKVVVDMNGQSVPTNIRIALAVDDNNVVSDKSPCYAKFSDTWE
jgi:hypothetical protein